MTPAPRGAETRLAGAAAAALGHRLPRTTPGGRAKNHCGGFDSRHRRRGPIAAPASTSTPDPPGAALVGRGDFAAALPITQEIAESAARVRGPDHMNTLLAQQNLARTYSGLDRFDDAEAIWIEVLPKIASQLPDPHPLAGLFIKSYGIELAEHNRDEDALVQLHESYRHLDATSGNEHPQAQQVVRWFVAIDDRRGDSDDAEKWPARLSK
ncbi:MAG: tetratricopeptide repeat protein [Planctomycetota bacterium]|nr:tetratricopeptide repeat protein [Planctomycetota bacterium]